MEATPRHPTVTSGPILFFSETARIIETSRGPKTDFWEKLVRQMWIVSGKIKTLAQSERSGSEFWTGHMLRVAAASGGFYFEKWPSQIPQLSF